MIEPRTTKETMVCNVAVNSSAWPSGGVCGTGSLVTAKVDTKMALTPIYANVSMKDAIGKSEVPGLWMVSDEIIYWPGSPGDRSLPK